MYDLRAALAATTTNKGKKVQLDQWLDEVAAMNLIDLYAEEAAIDSLPHLPIQSPPDAAHIRLR